MTYWVKNIPANAAGMIAEVREEGTSRILRAFALRDMDVNELTAMEIAVDNFRVKMAMEGILTQVIVTWLEYEPAELR